MGEKTLDALAGIVFIIIILGMHYMPLDYGISKPILWTFAILFHSYIFAKNAFPGKSWFISIPMGLILVFAIQSVIQTFWYYIDGSLGATSDAWSLALAIGISHISGLDIIKNYAADAGNPADILEDSDTWPTWRIVWAVILMSAAFAATVFTVYSSHLAATDIAIRTPWPLLPSGVLPAIAILWSLAIINYFAIRKSSLSAIHIFLALLATLTIAPLVYKMGFGFDGFLHIAGEKILLQTGTLTPKPFYYIGQYVLSTWLSRNLDLDLILINRWLVPVLASIILPASAYLSLPKNLRLAGAMMLPAFIPLQMFVTGTPQGLSLLVGIACLILSYGAYRGQTDSSAGVWLGIWSTAIHPLSGLPLLGLSLALSIAGVQNKWIKNLAWPCAILSGLSIPIVFYLASRFTGGLDINWNLQTLTNWQTWLSGFADLYPRLGNHYVLWPAWATIIKLTLPLFGLLLGLLSLVFSKNNRLPVGLILLTAVFLFVGSGLLGNASDFSFLISYERGDYAARLNLIAGMILLASGIPALAWSIDKLRRASPLAILTGVLFIASVGTANAYNSLPRHDAVEPSRGWSTSLDDVDAVRWIDWDASSHDYTVLANQAVSAAAVGQFGFKRYTADGTFYYPIPTGSKLYDIYLKMTYQDPSESTIQDASRLGQTSIVYVVINDYWWNAAELNEKITDLTPPAWQSKDGKVTVYRFKNN